MNAAPFLFLVLFSHIFEQLVFQLEMGLDNYYILDCYICGPTQHLQDLGFQSHTFHFLQQ
jgi:hypothetical protein